MIIEIEATPVPEDRDAAVGFFSPRYIDVDSVSIDYHVVQITEVERERLGAVLTDITDRLRADKL